MVNYPQTIQETIHNPTCIHIKIYCYLIFIFKG